MAPPPAMPLSHGLFLNEAPALIAFTGSGGKTTCSEALAHEACAAGRRAVVTTTTKIRVPSSHVDASCAADVARAFDGAHDPVYVGTVAADGKKMCAPADGVIDSLTDVADVVVVEADGSRGASVKAYRDGEPVLPARVDRRCVVVGVDAVGADRGSPLVHRAPILWPLLGLGDDARLTADDVVRAMTVQPAYLAGARRFPTAILLNKTDDDDAVARSDALLAALEPHLQGAGVVRVLRRGRAVLGGVEIAWQRPPRRRIAAVLLAAGGSTRFGGRKQTVPIGGVPMIAASMRPLLACGLEQLTVVLGHDHAEVEEAARGLVDDARVRYVVNPGWADGLGTSVAAGVRACPAGAGVLLALADMPYLSSDTVARLLEVFARSPFDIVAPTHDGRRGHPVLLDDRFRGALLGLAGDVGAAPLLRRHPAHLETVPVDDVGVIADVDRPSAVVGG